MGIEFGTLGTNYMEKLIIMIKGPKICWHS